MHTLTYRSTDAAGNSEADKTATVRIDTTAPVTNDDAPAGWSNTPVTVTLTATDSGGSGLTATEYKLDGAASFTSGTTVTVSGQGLHALTYRSTDAAGNTEADKTATVRIDTTAPVTSDDAPAGWSNGPVTVTLTAADTGGSGVATTEYKLDGAGSFTAGTTVAVSGEGVHTIAYRSIDRAGNTEVEKTTTVRIDTTAPVTSDDAPAGWSNHAVTVALAATDTGGSGLATTEYKLDGAASWSTGTSIAVSGDGVHSLTYRSSDAAGNTEADKTTTVRIDTTAPVTSDNAPTTWSDTSVTVTLSAADTGGSGLASTEFKLDGATIWSTGTSVAVAGDGIHTLTYRSGDAAGNTEADKTTIVRIDTTAPVTSDDAPVGWSNGAVTVTLTATDNGGSGVAKTEYSIDGGAWTDGNSVVVAAPGDHSNDGSHAISYRSTDQLGHLEVTRTAFVRIDTQTPRTSDDAPAGWRNNSVTVTLSAVDDGNAGVARTEYRIDAATTWTSGGTVTIPAPADHSNDGAHTISYRSIDSAGNLEAERTATVRIDTLAPQTTDNAPAGSSRQPVTVTLSATDAGSGVATTEYRVDGVAAWTTGSTVSIPAPANHSNDGLHTIRYRSTDAVGNVESERTATVRIDTIAPMTSDNASTGWSNSAVTVTLTPLDGTGSGVASTEYKIDAASSYSSGTTIAISAPADHSNDGTHTIRYHSTDAAGNVETERTATVRIDTTTPISDPAPTMVWTSGPSVVILTASDTGSGVARIEYRIDAAASWTVGKSVRILAPADHSNDGLHAIHYRAIDKAGNVEPDRTGAVAVDTSAPVTTDDAPAGWSATPVTVTLTPTDAGVGVDTTEYAVDGATVFETGTEVVIPAPADHSNDGVHTITYRSYDLFGHVETDRTATVRIDTTAPTTSDNAPAGWSNTTVTVTLSALDSPSGLTHTEYRLDGAGSWSTGTAVAVSGEGVHTLAYRSIDAAGNTEGDKTTTVRIDTTAPVTTDNAPTSWSNGPVTVTLTAGDTGGSGLAATEYKLDGATTWSTGTSVAVSGQAVHTLIYRSRDVAGNAEAEKTATVRIDTTAPVTSDDAATGWSNGPVTVSLSATDAGGSGVVKTEYRLDGAATWITGTSVAVSGQGVHTLAYRSTDSAGNTESEKTATVRIDTTAPITGDDAPMAWRNTSVTVTLSAGDAGGSGLVTTEFKLDGAGTWSTGTSVAVSGEGVHTLGYRSIDAAGNTEAVKTATVRIDATAPVTTDDAPAGWSNTTVTVTLSAGDSGGSGVATTEYRLDGAVAFTPGTSVAVSGHGRAHAALPLQRRGRQRRTGEDRDRADRYDGPGDRRRRACRLEQRRGDRHPHGDGRGSGRRGDRVQVGRRSRLYLR